MMKLGFASAIVPDISFESLVDFAYEQKFECIEVMCWPKGKAERRYAGVTHIDIENLNKEKADVIKTICRTKGIDISALAYYPNPLDPVVKAQTTAIEHIKKIIKKASLLDVDIVNTFIGRDPQKSVNENLKEFKRVWPDIIRQAEDSGVKVAIENCPMLFTEDEWPGGKNLAISPKIWETMFDIIPSKNFGLNYDPSHFIWQQMDYIKPIRDFTDKLFHIHIKDIKLYPEKLDEAGILATPLEYCSPKIPGLGDIKWDRFISTLMDVGYNGYVVIEVEDKAFEDSLENRKKAVVQSKSYINQYLR